MATHEVEQSDYRAAEKLLAELNDPPATLVEKAAALRQLDSDRADRLNRLEAEEKEHDLTVGGGTRIFIALLIGIATGSSYIIVTLLAAHLHGLPVESTLVQLGVLTTGWAGCCAVFIDKRMVSAALIFGLGTLCAIFIPKWVFEATAAAVIGGNAIIGWIWQVHEQKRQDPPS